MYHKLKYLITLSLICFSGINMYAQKGTDYGAAFSFELTKDLSRFLTLNVEEEIRLINNNQYNFDRSATSIGLDYTLIPQKVKVGAYYAFLYVYNSDYRFEPRHRFYFNLSYKEKINSFTFAWRGRIQQTVRDENRGSYNTNPKYALRNRLTVEYEFWKSQWTPYGSVEFTNPLNDSRYELSQIRFQGGVEYRMSRQSYLGLFLRYNINYEKGDNNFFGAGISYRMKM